MLLLKSLHWYPFVGCGQRVVRKIGKVHFFKQNRYFVLSLCEGKEETSCEKGILNYNKYLEEKKSDLRRA